MHPHTTEITFPLLSPSLCYPSSRGGASLWWCVIVLCLFGGDSFLEEFGGATRWSSGSGVGARKWSGDGGGGIRRKSSQVRKQDGKPFNEYENPSTDINIEGLPSV
ncbi:hypothetical protein LR48_Vigan01g101300 [Vigna angularis]|uniref:Uncharacterized protein n=1 Tax=Phaseolus angularis TaxID=3914 RepID=A0A0L9TLL1_PHAAN|nr:hypothetical protein LR48_Vigan01g101300 [Vigna angularis]